MLAAVFVRRIPFFGTACRAHWCRRSAESTGAENIITFNQEIRPYAIKKDPVCLSGADVS